jgi:Ran GTPase-activating protein (RanGAP) involved in mRNA processing and transport
LCLLEFYIVIQNRKIEELIASYDYHSTIDLSCQKLTDHDMAIILKYAVLEKKCQILNLWGNQFTYQSISILANILNGNQTLKELDLSYNHLSDKGVEIISKVLSLNNCVLKEIDLSSNGITDKGAEYLSNMLRKNQKLKFLILNKNDITNNGLILLSNSLVNDNKKLKHLKIESNPFITRTGIIHILNLLKNNQTLENIYIKNCSISDRDFYILEQMAFTTGFDIIV